jgi:hypothetical protein
MYCINCGVRLADTQEACPLCGTVPYHPDINQTPAPPLYPKHNLPRPAANSAAVNGPMLILFAIPLLITLLIDLHVDSRLTWFGFVAGALILTYVVLALPRWFRTPSPIVFVPCGFAAAALYLLYIDLTTGGSWFLSFAFPVTAGIGLITTTVVTLLRCLRRGRLYIFGSASIALGALMLLIEFLLTITFALRFAGWSFYPCAVLVLLGGWLLFLAVNRTARARVERKLFF